jgi:hypothetical protein
MPHFTNTTNILLCATSSAKKTTICRPLAITLFLLVIFLAGSAPAQVWTPVAAPFPGSGAHKALLLTDGTVMVQEGGGCCDGTQNWWTLTPDQSGSYINGAWSQSPLAPMPPGYAPAAYASAVLSDGRVIIEGGEFNFGVKESPETDLGAIFDPTINYPAGQWTSVNPPTGWDSIGDAPSVVLPEAPFNFMLGNCCTHDPTLYDAYLDPIALTWTPTGLYQAQYNSEHGWTLLPPMMDSPSGSVLVVNNLFPLTDGRASERYFPPPLGFWIPAGSTVVSLSDCGTDVGCEFGPAVLRPDGTVFAAGVSFTTSRAAHTAFYHTSISDPDYATWTAGPDYPYDQSGEGLGTADGPASLLPNGNILVAAAVGFDTPTSFYEFTTTNQWVSVPAPPGAVHDRTQDTELLLLPTGQVLFTDGQNDVEIYTPGDQTYNPAWAPVLCGGSCVGSTHLIHILKTNTISGLQFNGMSQATMFGDDSQMATNYPLVRITADSVCTPKECFPPVLYYCRTHDHSSMGVATGTLVVSTLFECPFMFPPPRGGTLEVVANGIPSNPMRVSIEP